MSAGKDRRRKGDIVRIHVLKGALGIDRDTYEDILMTCGRVTTSTELDSHGRRETIKQLEYLLRQRDPQHPQLQRRGQYPGKPHNFAQLPEMIAKIEAQLADMKLPWSYADAIAKRQCGVAKVAWLRKEQDLRAIVAALDVEQTKRQLNQRIDDYVRLLGWSQAQLDELTAKMPKNWRRQIKPMQLVCAQLSKLERDTCSLEGEIA